MTRKNAQLLALSPLVALFAVGCASQPRPAIATEMTGANVYTQGKGAATNAPPTSSSVVIEDRILRACGDIPQAHFAFDSTKVQPDAANALTALARCFSTGPLAGQAMRLVGRADPRGESDYNLALGQRRAGSVAQFVESRGVSPAKLAATSRGAFDATGTDDQGWAKDRRVDVLLAN